MLGRAELGFPECGRDRESDHGKHGEGQERAARAVVLGEEAEDRELRQTAAAVHQALKKKAATR